MSRIHDFSSDDIKDGGARIVRDWTAISMKIAPKLKMTSISDLIQFGKVLQARKGKLHQKLLEVKVGLKDMAVGNSLFGKGVPSATRAKVVGAILTPQINLQIAATTLSLHERSDGNGPYLCLVIHRPTEQKEILTSRDSAKVVI